MLTMHVLDAWHHMCLFEEHLDAVDETRAILCDCVSSKLVNNRKRNMIKTVASKTQGEVFSCYFSRVKLWGFFYSHLPILLGKYYLESEE